MISIPTVCQQFPFLHNGSHHLFQHAISHGGFFFKNRYHVVIHVRVCRTWEWLYFNQTFVWHFALINTGNHRISNESACSFWPVVFNSIFIFFLGFLLLCCYFLRRSIFIFITWIRITLRICVLIKVGLSRLRKFLLN